MIELAPSLLAADMLNLERDIQGMLDNGVNLLHFDVMDAHFVPNLSFGTELCREIHQRFPALRLDVHLMMDQPEKYVAVFAADGADSLTVHREVQADVAPLLRQIKDLGLRCGLSVKPGTGAETLLPYLDMLDIVLIMTVEPGFGGQAFQPEQMEKIRLLRSAGFRGVISVDGGVNIENAPLLVSAGANRLVMGTAYFQAGDQKKVIRAVRSMQ